MASATAFRLLAVLVLASSAATAFNVTEILNQYPDLGAFNALLSETGVASEINARQTITVLAVGSDALDAVSGRPVEVVKRILSLHVVLDYYDANKLKKITKSAILTTLYQTTGAAGGQSGFLNVTVNGGGVVEFGSAAAGEPLGSTLVKEVVKKPYNISILQVSDVIEPRGIDNNGGPPTPSPPSSTPAISPSSTPAISPSSSPKKAPAPSTPSAPSPSGGNATAPSSDAADAPDAAAVVAPSPDSSTSSDSPAPAAAADGPADSKDAAAPSDHASSAGRAVAAAAGATIVAVAMAGAWF